MSAEDEVKPEATTLSNCSPYSPPTRWHCGPRSAQQIAVAHTEPRRPCGCIMTSEDPQEHATSADIVVENPSQSIDHGALVSHPQANLSKLTPTTAISKKASLLSLPAEVRLQILRHLVTGQLIIPHLTFSAHRGFELRARYGESGTRFLAHEDRAGELVPWTDSCVRNRLVLTQICRTLYRETTALFHAGCILSIPPGLQTRPWASCFPSTSLYQMQHVRLDWPHWSIVPNNPMHPTRGHRPDDSVLKAWEGLWQCLSAMKLSTLMIRLVFATSTELLNWDQLFTETMRTHHPPESTAFDIAITRYDPWPDLTVIPAEGPPDLESLTFSAWRGVYDFSDIRRRYTQWLASASPPRRRVRQRV